MIPFFGGDERERRMLDTVTIRYLGRLLELLAAGAVHPLVVRDVQVIGAPLLDALEQRYDAADVARLGRADPIVVRAFERAPIVGERRRHAVHPFARADVRPRGRLDHGLAVLVHAHQEVHLVAAQAAVPGDAVRADFFQSVPQVGIAIGVVDGRREKVLRALHYSGSWSSVTTRVLPASDRRVTRSRKMSTATTCSMPSEVLSAFPSFGKRFRCCT